MLGDGLLDTSREKTRSFAHGGLKGRGARAGRMCYDCLSEMEGWAEGRGLPSPSDSIS